MQQLASGLNKLKRQSIFNAAIATGITEIVWQVTTYRKIFLGGCQRQILGRIITLPVNQATLGLQRGSFRATRSQNGKRLRPEVPFCGFMGNVR